MNAEKVDDLHERLIRVEATFESYQTLIRAELNAKDKAVELYAKTLELTLSQLSAAKEEAHKFHQRAIGMALTASALSGLIIGLVVIIFSRVRQ